MRGPGCASAPGHGGRCAAPVVGGGCWGGGGGAAAAGGAEGGLAGGSGAWRRRWWEAAGGSAGPAGPGDGGRGGLPGGQAAVASVLGPCGLSFGLGPHGGGGSERRSWACAAHSGLASRHGAGHERGGAPGPSGEWRPRRAREAGAVGPVGGLPGGLCEGGGEAGVTQFRAPGSPERPPPAPRRLGTRALAGVASASGCAPQFLLGGGRGARKLVLLLLAGRPRLLGDPALRTPPPTPSEQALEPWVPGTRKIHLEDADLESPGRLGGLALGSHPPAALSAARMWVAAGGSEAAVGAAWGFFFFFFKSGTYFLLV